MIKLILRITIYGSAAAAGLGIITKSWLIGTFAAIYVLSIFDESESAPNGNFRNLESEEFMASELNIKKRLGIRLVYAGILFVVCLGISQFV